MVGQNSKCPLRLTFEAREGEQVVDEAPVQLALEAREGMGGEEIEMPLQLKFEAREGGG